MRVRVADVLSLRFEIYDEDTDSYAVGNEMKMDVSSGQFSSALARITASTNNATGYSLQLEDLDHNNVLASETSDKQITALEDKVELADATDTGKDFPDNKWGYSLNGTVYKAVTNQAAEIAGTEGPGETTYPFTVATRVDRLMPAGEYTGKVLITLVANASSDTRTIFDIDTMQDMTATICRNTPTPSTTTDLASTLAEITVDNETGLANKVPTTIMEDERDGQTYTIRKLADGNCWMTENLRLAKNGAVELNDVTSDMSNGRTFTVNAAVAPGAAGSWDNQAEKNIAIYRNDDEHLTPSTTGNPLNTVLYNWYTATAGAQDSNGNSLMTATGGQAADSICPYGWQLPINSQSTSAGVKSYGHLVGVYTGNAANRNGETSGQTTDSVQADLAKLHDGPTSFVYSDYYGYGGSLYSGATGNYWSSTVTTATYSYHLGLDTHTSPYALNPQNSNGKGDAFAVRCVAK